jgi:large subunit ribosomal protein L19
MSYSCPTIEAIENVQRRGDLPEFRAGDTIKVHALISEGGKERIQIFEGVCIHRKRGGARGSFTVRKVSHGVGVERVFMEGSSRVVKIELVTRGRVRRAKLYYLRELRGNAARIKAKLGGYASTLATTEEEDRGEPELAPEAEAALEAETNKGEAPAEKAEAPAAEKTAGDGE